MNNYFLTQDFNGNDKQDDADFHKIEAGTLAEAVKIFAKGKYSFAAVRDAEYSDTWLKMFNEPEVGDRALSPFSLKEGDPVQVIVTRKSGVADRLCLKAESV